MTAVEGVSELRLDWNESPIGPPQAAIGRMRAAAAELHRYPRGLLESVTAKVAGRHGVDPESVLLTTGVDEAVDLVLTLVDSAWFVTPGFDGYQARAEVLRRGSESIPLDADWQPIGLPHEYEMGPEDAVFVAQPNNPTGNIFRPEWVSRIADTAGIVFLDATYQDFVADGTRVDALGAHPRVVRFYSFSKAYGLAGIRVGVLIGAPLLIATLRAHSRFHGVDSITLAAVDGVLDDDAYRIRIRDLVLAQRPRYVAALSQVPVFAEVRDTEANFVLARCGAGVEAATLIRQLAVLGVWIKDCAQFGLPGWVRITVGTAGDLTRLVSALAVCDDLVVAGGEY
ncbi:pyridoxal phosphate-dependent aminotransferase [Nocardia sp. NPDC052566]|uniref:pyridoxal phosphate-dependent aminotransferase n=1 Tax=Nocardia sp. NPDC052566 TaxID=3364330 RepID=UPI0037C91239